MSLEDVIGQLLRLLNRDVGQNWVTRLMDSSLHRLKLVWTLLDNSSDLLSAVVIFGRLTH